MELKKENIKKILFILFATVAFCIGLINLSSVWEAVKKIASVLTPVIIGLCLAFVLEPLSTIMEIKVFGFIEHRLGSKGRQTARALGIFLAIVIIVGTLVILGLLVVPEIREAVSIIGQTIPRATTEAAVSINSLLERLDVEFRIPIGGTAEWMTTLAKLRQYINTLLDEGYLSNLADTALTVVSGFTNFVLGFILSLYVLGQKRQILSFFGRLTKAIFRPVAVKHIFKVTALCNSAFRNFVTGQLTEAVIIAALCFLGMIIFRFPYPTATSAVVGLSALIPVFGAWIGGILGAVLALSESVTKALLFILFIVVLQQIEGDFIYPRVVGKSVGLPGVLVFVAVMLGASVSGVVGMIVAVPVCSVVYTLIKEFIDRRLEKKSGIMNPPDTPPDKHSEHEEPTAQE